MQATSLLSGGVEVVDSQGNDFNARISGGTQLVSGTTNSTIIFAGGLEVVEPGGNANNTTVSSGGTLEVESGGGNVGTHLLSGATLIIGGTLSGFVVSSGVTLEVSGTTASNTTVLRGGTLELVAGGSRPPRSAPAASSKSVPAPRCPAIR